ncbi:hypothetical protein PC123_g16109 [Phytophthora cactorum]|nr:hypothetical protein PC123_g16109 [Phytophthora cactorum]
MAGPAFGTLALQRHRREPKPLPQEYHLSLQGRLGGHAALCLSRRRIP